MTDRVVLNIPHSSELFPSGKNRWDEGIDAQINRWTDWFTDFLFIPEQESDIHPVVFPYSRFFCDVERLEDDPLEENGQGIVYLNFDGLQRHLSKDEAGAIKREFYDAHVGKLRSLLTPTSFLLDCHSFPPELSNVEVCIGFNEDWSRPDDRILLRTMELFRDEGYKTSFNQPYSNSISPRMPFSYQSMMIELNKKTYMTHDGRLDYDKAGRIRSLIQSLYDEILGF